MQKEEFNYKVDQLIEKLEKLEDLNHYELNYDDALKLVDDFNQLAKLGMFNGFITNPFTSEHVIAIKISFENSRKSKKIKDKLDYWKEGITALKADVKSLNNNGYSRF